MTCTRRTCDSEMVCFYCEVPVTRHEHDHAPVPRRAGGDSVVVTCVGCHNTAALGVALSWDMAYFHVMPNIHTQPNKGEDFLSVTQAASELDLTPRAIRHRISVGTLAAVKLGPGTASYVITRAEIERVKAERAVA